MRKWSIAVLVALLLGGLCVSLSQKMALSFETLFPEELQQKMGLQKLTDFEKEALRSHVENLIEIFLDNGYQPSGGSGSPPSINNRQTPFSSQEYIGAGLGHWVRKNIDSGSYVELEDGSLWQIDPMDKIDAMLWLPISNITITYSSNGSVGFNYLLINTDDGEKAHAKFIGKE